MLTDDIHIYIYRERTVLEMPLLNLNYPKVISLDSVKFKEKRDHVHSLPGNIRAVT